MHTLILVEGETELEFIGSIAGQFFPRHPKTIRNLRGNFNINAKVVDKILGFSNQHPHLTFSVCVCIDQERIGVPPLDITQIKTELARYSLTPKIVPVIALLMTESLLFADIEGIYAFLRASHSKRKPRNFDNFRRLTHHDLQRLFRQFGKQYVKGHRVENFVSKLNIKKIVSRCDELLLLVGHCTRSDN